jgi:two-component system, OmpR family, sensor histidine kinase KdpD
MPLAESCSSRSPVYPLALRFAPMALRIAGALIAIAAVTFGCIRIVPVGAPAAGFFYLVAIVVIARGWGLAEAVAASVAALAGFEYFFLHPSGSFTLNQPISIEAFIGFLAAATAVSFLAARPSRSDSAIDRQREMESLYALSRAILLVDPARPVAKQIAYHIAQIFQFPAVALYDRHSGEILSGGPEDLPGIEDKLRQAAMQGTLFQDEESETLVNAVRLGGGPIGSMALRGAKLSDGALHALSNLVAVGLERARGQEAANRAAAAQQSQELKSALLDAIAHEFKTPLTSIKAAATALLSGSVGKAIEQRELISIVNEEADRLRRLVGEAIQMARLEAGKNQISRELHSAPALIDAALEPLRPMMDGRELRIRVQPDLPFVLVDMELLGLAIRQLVDNALKYSPPDAPVTIGCRAADGRVLITVSDFGPGIAETDQLRIFEKFYRSPAVSNNVVGEGMGLTIARKILDAHSGDIRVQSKPGEGAEFVISLPVCCQGMPV